KVAKQQIRLHSVAARRASRRSGKHSRKGEEMGVIHRPGRRRCELVHVVRGFRWSELMEALPGSQIVANDGNCAQGIKARIRSSHPVFCKGPEAHRLPQEINAQMRS